VDLKFIILKKSTNCILYKSKLISINLLLNNKKSISFDIFFWRRDFQKFLDMKTECFNLKKYFFFKYNKIYFQSIQKLIRRGKNTLSLSIRLIAVELGATLEQQSRGHFSKKYNNIDVFPTTRTIFYRRISKIILSLWRIETERSKENASGTDDTVALTVKNDMVGHFLEIPTNWEITAMIFVDRLLQHVRVSIEKKQDWRLRATIKRRECLKWPHSFPTLSRLKNVTTYTTSNVQDRIQ